MPSPHVIVLVAAYTTAAGLFLSAAVVNVRRGKRTEAELRARLASETTPVYNNTAKPFRSGVFVPELPVGTKITVKPKPPATRKSD